MRNRNFSPFYQCRRRDIRDGLQEFQIKELVKLLKHPIGMLGTHDDTLSSSFSTGNVGYKGITTKDIQRRARWVAHMHGVPSLSLLLLIEIGVAEIRALQYHAQLLHLSSEERHNEGSFNRRKMSSLSKFSSLPDPPYAVITLSEFGIPKKWSWRGIPLDSETDIGLSRI